jgi:hypothetical protein
MQTIKRAGRTNTSCAVGALGFAALLFLIGCQGVSTDVQQQQQSGTLYLPQTLNFGSVAAGSSSTLTLTAMNPGPGPVNITSSTISTQYFSLTVPSLPVTIGAGQAATISIAFSPNSTGTFDATLTVSSNATDAQTSVSLSGTGTAAAAHTVNLAWDASTSPDIAGYNIYRAVYDGSCGSFSRLNSSLNAGLSYSDTAVIGGTSYCYATTAVNTSSQESTYSNVYANVQIPSP